MHNHILLHSSLEQVSIGERVEPLLLQPNLELRCHIRQERRWQLAPRCEAGERHR